MRRPLAASLLAVATACGSLDEVDVSRSAEFTVPGAPGAPALALTVPVPVPVGRSVLEAEGIDPNDVDAARLRALRLEVVATDPVGSSFETWLDEVSVFVEASGLGRALVARRTGVRALPAGTTVIDLETTGVDLKPFLLAPTATLTADAVGVAPASETKIRATATLRVDVSVSGLFD
jgi:hypothetical protein